MKKIFVIAALLSVFAPAGFLVAQQTRKENPRPPEWSVPGEIETISTPTTTNYLYPDNSNKKESQLIKKERAVGQLKKELSLKQVKLQKYSDYIEYKKNRGGDIIENLMVHPNRLVWLVEIDAPNGLEIKQGNDGKVNKFKKANIIMVVDAETGERFGTDIIEIP